jgi:carboxypeptidase Taq
MFVHREPGSHVPAPAAHRSKSARRPGALPSAGTMRSQLEEMNARAAELRDLERVLSVLRWDQRVNLPPGGAAARARQTQRLAALHHAHLIDPELGELIEVLGEADGLSPLDRASVARLRRRRDHAVRVPARGGGELALATSLGYSAWEQARPRNDFEAFVPHLERIVELEREQAEALGYEGEPYDALLDLFEEGATVAEVEPMLRGLAAELRPLLDRVLQSGIDPGRIPPGPYPKWAQLQYATGLAGRLGYDLERGRVDLSAHPFEINLGEGDVRITTRYFEDDFIRGLLGAAHETGHALYEQGLPDDLTDSYAGMAPSHGAHESQSRLWENHVARSLPFFEAELPHLCQHLGALRGVGAETIFRAANRVQPSLIRVEADEVTYPLHIVVRFEVELALMRREIGVREMPEAFNQAMRRHLGIVPPDHRDGVMQDSHWGQGFIGYFPTYAMGSVYAAAIFERICESLGGLEAVEADIRAGRFDRILAWLRSNFHSLGSTVRTRELMARAAGIPADGPIDVAPFLRHLRRRTGQVYG